MEGGLQFIFVGGVKLLGAVTFGGGVLDPPAHHDYNISFGLSDLDRRSFKNFCHPGLKIVFLQLCSDR